MRELLYQMNPWWEDGEVPKEAVGVPRPRQLEVLLKDCERREVTLLTGPRRTGKTTILHQLIARLIQDGTSPSKVLYVQFDHPGLAVDDPIRAAKKVFEEATATSKKETTCQFFDEVQHVPGWARWAKAIHDTEKAKLFISGSTTGVIEQDAQGSLIGRYTKRRLLPLTFGEYLELRGAVVSGADTHLYRSHLSEYMSRGGFPQAALEEDDARRKAMHVLYFQDMIYRDVAKTRQVRDIEAVLRVATHLIRSIGTPVSLLKIKNVLKISMGAVNQYIDALGRCYVFGTVPYWSRSLNETTYNPRKYYLSDHGLSRSIDMSISAGSVAENSLYCSLARFGEPYYWKDLNEVDFVFPGSRVAVESKYREDVQEKDIKGLMRYLAFARLKHGYVVTDDLEDRKVIKGRAIDFVPLWRFLLETENITGLKSSSYILG